MLGKQLREYGENEIVFREGDQGDWAYLIESGRILVYVEKDGLEVPLKVLGKGEIFGEMSLIDNSPRSASCRTISEVRLITVTQDQLLARIQAADPVVRLLMRALLDRLRLQNDGIRGRSIPTLTTNIAQIEREKNEALERISLEHQISAALDNKEFTPYYQPIFDLRTQEMVGCEALLRWIKKDGQIIPPGSFIDALEQSPLILNVGQVMIEMCVADLVKMKKRNPAMADDFFVSVNVSGRQFSDRNFVTELEKIRSAAGVASRQLKLEVTERIMAEGPMAINTLRNCRAMGYKIAIDDFGTGFSSLQYLASMPLHDLKVDRSFITQMMNNEKSLSIVKTLIHMANLMNLNLIAEGIETQEQLLLLRQLGVQMGQGYLFAKPMEFESLMLMTEAGHQLKQAA